MFSKQKAKSSAMKKTQKTLKIKNIKNIFYIYGKNVSKMTYISVRWDVKPQRKQSSCLKGEN